jgi:AmmeMemoRadiSam system protein B
MARIIETRPSPIAGYWYSGNPHVLRSEIFSYLDNVNVTDLHGEVIGLFAPHAGYRYSGQTAAYAFHTVKDKKFDLVVILSPYHAYHSATILSSAHQNYQTPLGKIQIDQDLVEALMDKIHLDSDLKMVRVVQDEEHSLEIELPFLQCVLESDFRILPLMVRSIDPGYSELIADFIFELIKGKNILIVASTDLSHFYSQSIAEQLDTEMLKQIQSFSVSQIYQTEFEGKGYACGLGAIMVSMALCKKLGADTIEILHQTTSGKETGDFSSVVGYGAGVFIKSKA